VKIVWARAVIADRRIDAKTQAAAAALFRAAGIMLGVDADGKRMVMQRL
jgi:hypothetical protein